ncbi:MAG: hypothetical protein B7O98_08980 [Zestosphaera tikiterensis]|uniref:Uncharacterized protein n=1 Tax=Zestosphaera tikiterensis TaxID=1973259 RepID=A0A2R7Y468_9CREN|nr:MAG: hypothetical protein B7O98_08980 [Zestosphaera tikiterensis]
MYIHRDKIKCAIDLLEKGASQREIAKACGLSMSQVSAIGREYGYYVDVKEHFEKLKEEKKREYEAFRNSILEEKKKLETELRDLSERLEALKDEEKALRKSVEDLRHVEESLKQEIGTLVNALKIVCFHYQAYRAEAEKHMESLEKAIGSEVWKFLEEIEALMSPELLKDLEEFGNSLDRIAVTKEYREYLKSRFERVASALRSLFVLLNKGGYFVNLMVLAQLRDLCSIVDVLERVSKKETR